jgi:hypothetical protein
LTQVRRGDVFQGQEAFAVPLYLGGGDPAVEVEALQEPPEGAAIDALSPDRTT